MRRQFTAAATVVPYSAILSAAAEAHCRGCGRVVAFALYLLSVSQQASSARDAGDLPGHALRLPHACAQPSATGAPNAHEGTKNARTGTKNANKATTAMHACALLLQARRCRSVHPMRPVVRVAPPQLLSAKRAGGAALPWLRKPQQAAAATAAASGSKCIDRSDPSLVGHAAALARMALVQMGGCFHNGTAEQQACRAQVRRPLLLAPVLIACFGDVDAEVCH